jgi:hypothetical protein
MSAFAGNFLSLIRTAALLALVILAYRAYQRITLVVPAIERTLYCEQRIDALTIRVNTSLMMMQHAYDRYDEEGKIK